MSPGDKIASCHTRKKYEVMELGIMHPEELPTTCLQPGQVGFIACNMKAASEGNGLVWRDLPVLRSLTISSYR
jgi:translation elongation factor EF-4